ncbi:GNAT family N-acetyltransferase [Petrotoga sp. 9PWA.NaAc.5.4]|uniref:GNAT family N-acetyltransferase n=1 Tax=Petrotoga sp. 9PWA.NaAc.5.4 TaxID=1434328 RepID=UPI000CB60EAB|nr:GNAT family N-acetyltransferase [Petrotoga sp. 9PWA.NaAc.5.4]PNR93966.1 GCN5 family acetyltransferase [Petrotoga sp. 9PWA.NaAc.5.4]
MYTYKPLKEVPTTTVIEFVNEVFKDYLVPVNWTLESFEKDIREYSISLEDSFVVFLNEKAVGFSIISTRNKIGRIDSIGVKEEFRGSGLASEIMFKTIENLKWKGIETLILEVVDLDKRSIRFYEKHGFREKRKLISYFKKKDTQKNSHISFYYEKTTSDIIYDMAIEAKFKLKRSPNWQRDPLTLKLSGERYNYETISSQKIGKVGYLVWGSNKDNCFIVDVAPTNENIEFDVLIQDVTFKLFSENKEIIIISVPEDDPLNEALIRNEYNKFIQQIEMERKIH